MICVAYPTIMDGLVLRWWVDLAAYEAHDEIASASRNCFIVADQCPVEIRTAADQAHSYLAVEYAAHAHPRLSVARWVTHRTVGIFSRAIEPVVEVARG